MPREALDDVIEEIRPHLRESVRRLETLLGRPFEEWTTTLEGPGHPRDTS